MGISVIRSSVGLIASGSKKAHLNMDFAQIGLLLLGLFALGAAKGVKESNDDYNLLNDRSKLSETDERGLFQKFQCNDETGKELYMSWVCDGTKDCTNGRDESDAVCGECPGPGDHGGFRCNYPNCKILPTYYRCDRTKDCPDGEDEEDC